MGDYDYLDDMFANAYKRHEEGNWDQRKRWEVNIALDQKKKKAVQPRKDFLRKNSPPKRLQKPKKKEIQNDPQKFISHKKMTKKQMSNLVKIYGSDEHGAGIYADFESNVPKAKKAQDVAMKKSLTESSIPTPATIPIELTYTNSEKNPAKKKLKKKKLKKSKSMEPDYAISGMKFDPLTATERHYHQQQTFVNMDKKSITFNEFSGALNESASNLPSDAKKNVFQISSILKSTSKVSKNLNDSMQYSYLFSPKKTEDNPKAGMDFEKVSNQEKDNDRDSLSLLEQKDTPALTVKLAGGSDIHNFPEWTSLRDNYITQLQNLNYHQDLVHKSDMVSDISIPNFIGLLIAIRKISFRIVDKYRQVILYDEKHENFKEMNAYIIKMATDVNCINRQPFVDWMGLSPIYNTFFAERKIDGTSALFADKAQEPKGLKFQGEFQNVRNDELCEELYKDIYEKKPVYMRKELMMTTREKQIVEELGGVVWSAYCSYQEAMHHKRAAEAIEGLSADNLENFDNNNITSVREGNNASYHSGYNEESFLETGGALENQSAVMNTAANYSMVSTFTSIRPMHMKSHLKVSWRKWRRLFLIKSGLRNLEEGRIYCTKRKVLDGWQKYSWQNMEFRRLQQRRWKQLMTFTFDAWFQYLHWCRKFNRVLKMANHENMRRVLKRMRVFSLYVHDNRNFKWKQYNMPLIITFRALKDNATINKFIMSQKLKRASQFTFADLNLRQFFFDKWHHFKNISMATETIDIALLVYSLRDAMNEWKSLAWPRRYRSRRNLRVFKKGFFGQTSTVIEEDEEEDGGGYVDKKNEYMWPQQEYYGNPVVPEFGQPDSNQNGGGDKVEDLHDLAGGGGEQEKWQMAALMGDGDDKSSASKRSWFTFSSLLSKK